MTRAFAYSTSVEVFKSALPCKLKSVSSRQHKQQLKKLRRSGTTSEYLQSMALFYLQLLLLIGSLYEASSLTPAVADTACSDQVDTRRCMVEKSRLGCQHELMQINCASTCKVCGRKALAPPVNVDCKDTVYGCCWDGKTTKHDFQGKDCPPCEDDKVFAALCIIWAKHCDDDNRPVEHAHVNKYCHKTCKKCLVRKRVAEQQEVRTLPPANGHFVNSDDSPRRGAIYVWTKLYNPFASDGYDRQ